MIFRALSRFLLGTLRGRLIIGVALVHAVMMTLFIADLTERQRAMLLERQIEEATALSQALATSAAGWIAADDISGLQELVEIQRRYPELLFATLVDNEARVLANTDKSKRGLRLLDLPGEPRQTVLSKSPALVDVATPSVIGGRHVGWARVGIGQKAAGEKLAGIIRSGVVYALAAILIGSVIAWFMGRGITRRLYAVQETIDAIRSGNRLARSPLTGADEAALMAREFNAMLDALAKRDAELRISEERYRTLIQELQTGVVVHAADTRIVTCNFAAQMLLGLTEAQLLGKAAIDPAWHFFREDRTVMPQEEYPVNHVLTTHQPIKNQVVGVRRPSGVQDVWAMVNANPVFSPENEISEVIVTFTDITGHRQDQERIAHLASIVESSDDAIIGKTLDETIVSWNQGAARIYGYSAAEIVGRSISMIVPPDLANELAAIMERLKRGDRVEHFETTRLRKDGQIIHVALTISPIRDADGRVVGASTIARDITERKRAEDALRLSAERLQLATRVANIGIWDWDVVKNELVWDDSMYPLYGIRREDFRGAYDAWIRTIHPEDKAHTDAEIQAALRGEREYAPEFRIIRTDGSIRYIKADSITTRDSEGKPLRMIGTNIDITENKQVEVRIRSINQALEQRVAERTTQLEAANKELEAFAYSVSHDLRAPLRHIDGFLGLLKENASAPLDEKSRHYMDTISKAAKRMGMLIDDLLSFSRMGRKEFTQTPVDLGTLVREVIHEFEPETAGRTIDWRIDDLPVIAGDRAMLRVALVNLISNALKFTQPRAQVEIAIGSLPGHETESVVFVRDNGVGFDMRYADKLFCVFERLHGVEEFEGTGIGLANAHRVISRHGGRMWAEGKVDGGATFYFSLPRMGSA